MDEQINIITLIALIVAVVAIFKLRSVLGRHTEDDDHRAEQRFRNQRDANDQDQGSDNVVTLPNVTREDANVEQGPEASAQQAEERIKTFAGDHKSVADGLMEILKKDLNFNPDDFIEGARHAYELIVTAFAEGNRSELKKLLGTEVYDGFQRAISEREGRGDQIDQSFVGIEKADILEADVNSGFANVTMRFVSQLISATRDSAGTVISGDPQKIKEVTDIWTFSRDVSSARAIANPNWKLVATQAPH